MKYLVYIPSNVTLGSSPVTAEYKVTVTSPTASTDTRLINVYSGKDLTNGSTLKLNGTGTGTSETIDYTVMLGTSTQVKTTTVIASAPVNGTIPDPDTRSGTLTFGEITMTGKKAGSYTDTLTFTVKVEEPAN